ncbi:MAG: glycosyl hydrolase family 18 protein, partial [Actinobacteria bacterium]|nr:glycosyl hydrolase family 18 protein [Actinomycetota bacterium]
MNRSRKAQARSGRSLAVFISSLALLLSGSASNSAFSADPPVRKILTGWIPYYSMDTSMASAVTNGDLIREVMPFWYTLKSESKITDLYTPANPSIPISTPLTTMRDSGFLVLPTITDGTAKSVLAGILRSPTTRSKLVSTITTLVVSNNFDGIDLDFEGFAFVDGTASWNSTRPDWVFFINELSISLHALGKILSVTTPVLFDPASGKKGYYVFDWASIAPAIDRLRIMTYDYSTSSPGPIGPLPWIEQSLQYAVSVVPASKIYIGVAGYGRDWVTKVSGICPSQYASTVVAGAKAATFVMNKAATLAASYGAIPTYNVTFGEETFTYQKAYSGTTSTGLATTCTATRVAWYQDAESYGARASLVSKYQLGGIAAWTLGMEDSTAMQAVRQVAVSIAPDLVLATISTDLTSVAYGNLVNVSGTFQRMDGTPIAG